MKDNEYQCAKCGKVYEKRVPDEEAWAEHDRNFPGESHETAEIVCDDCYKAMVAIVPPPGMESAPFPVCWRWQKDGDEVYGRSPGLEAINDYLQAVKEANERNTKQALRTFRLRLKQPFSLWWRITHPFQYRAVKKWLRDCEEQTKKELENTYFKLLYGEAKLPDQKTCGRSPLAAAMKDIAVMNEVKKLNQEIRKAFQVPRDIL